MTKLVVLCVFLVVLVAGGGGSSVSQPVVPVQPVQSQTNTAAVLTSNPLDFTLPVVGPNGQTGQSITLSSFRGKVLFIEFMEPWAPHCLVMAPTIEDLYKQYGGSVTFISVSGPWQGATIADTSTFIRTYGSSWTYVFDSSESVMNAYGVTSVPMFVFVSRDGTITYVDQGEQTRSELAFRISQAMAIQPTPIVISATTSTATIISKQSAVSTIGFSLPTGQFYGGLAVVFAILFAITLALLLKKKSRQD